MFDGRWDEGLTDAQSAAASHGDAPLIVLAGAGTGKTRTLTSRVAALVDRGVKPERILLLTFTRRAAAQMLTRAAAMCSDPSAGRRLWGGTFHAVAHALVTASAENFGLPEGVSVIDPQDAADLMDLLRRDHKLADGHQRVPRGATVLDIYSRAVNTGRPARRVIDEQFPWVQPHTPAVLDLIREYSARKRSQALLDFDDLLLGCRTLLADPVLGEAIRQRFDHVLVDEYQDVNQIQVDIVDLLCPDGTGLTVVGDDAQAVYGFRGADSRHLRGLESRLPHARTVALEDNFRSRQRLLDLANVARPDATEQPIQLRSSRHGGRRPRLVQCYDSSAEATLIVDAVLAEVEQGHRLRDQAVLMRAAHHSDLLEVELTARRVPFVKYGGLKFLEAAHVKDFVAALRVLDNRRDELAWFRLLRLNDGIGPARARDLLETWQPATADADSREAEVVAAAPAAARVSLTAMMRGLSDARRAPSVPQRAEAVLALLDPLLGARYPDAEVRLADLSRLVGAAGTATSVHDFVVSLTLDPPASTTDNAQPPHLDEDYLVLSTIHSAKGLEWDSVHLINVVDGAFPSDIALSSPDRIAEEERLFYVAVTRARDDLSVYVPLRQPHHRRARDDRHSYAQASRFIGDAARAVMEIVPEAPRPRPMLQPTASHIRVEMPTMEDLWA